MKKLLFFFFFMAGSLASRAQTIWKCDDAWVSFFSSAPIEDIEAKTNEAVSRINAETGRISFRIPVKSFQFDNSLMQSHFNTDYMESKTFPDATFIGQIQDSVFFSKEGQYPVMVSGKLTIHGVTQSYTGPATLTVKGNRVSGQTTFKVRLTDYNIKIPTLLTRNIAEEVEVKVNAVYQTGEKSL